MAVKRWIGKRTKRDRGGNVTGVVWRARYTDDLGREHTRHFPTKREGLAWLDDATAALATGTHVAPADGDLTLRQHHAAFVAVQVWEKTTIRACTRAVESAPFVDQPLRAITTSAAQAWVKAMSSAGLAPSTIHTRVKYVRLVLRAAVTDRRIPRDPTAGVKLPPLRKREAAMVIPTTTEVGSLIGLGTYWAPAWAVCAFAGLRIGEVCALQPGDVDFLTRRIHVRRQVVEVPGGVEVRLPKHRSERSVDVPDELLLMLARHLESQPHRGWVFGFDDPPTPGAVRYRWRQALAAAGITYTLRVHDLRHFFASGLISAGLDVVTVQKALGHASPAITLSTYAHLWPDAGDRIRRASAGLWSQIRDYDGTTGTQSGS